MNKCDDCNVRKTFVEVYRYYFVDEKDCPMAQQVGECPKTRPYKFEGAREISLKGFALKGESKDVEAGD